jgi:polar amino acid transport system substrate-binding protein
MYGLADNPKLADVNTVDDLNREGLTMAYFTGTPPETWAPTRFPKVTMKGVAGSGANTPIEEILAKRADFATIDNVAWPQLAKQVPGLKSFPAGDECLQSTEMSTGVGLAVAKDDTVFRDWLQAVYDEVKDAVTAEELKLLKSGA